MEQTHSKKIHEILALLSQANGSSKQGLICSRKKQRTKNNDQEETKETKTSNTHTNSKNKFQAFVSQRDQEKKIELINIIN